MKNRETVVETDVSEASQAPSPLDGSSLGKYTDLKLIGEGGQAMVYSAKDTTLGGRVVALKVLKKSEKKNKEYIERFRREIHLQAKLDIPGCVKIYDCGEDQGWFFFSMELIDGKPLSEIILEGLSLKKRISILKRIAEILKELHSQKLTHRDIKLQNIMIDGRGEIRLLDFGLMKETSTYPKDLFQTQAGIFTGTPASTAPELTEPMPASQSDSETPSRVDSTCTASADIFSLGVLAYELLSGKYPFEIEGLEMKEALEVIRTEQPVSLSSVSDGVPKNITNIVMSALSKTPSERPSAAKFADEMQRGLKALDKSPMIKKLTAAAAGIIIAFIILFAVMHDSETGTQAPSSQTPAIHKDNSTGTLLPLFSDLDSKGIKFVMIRPGTFTMGSNNGDSDEKPPHTVNITDNFWIGTTEVTEELYNKVINNDSQSESNKRTDTKSGNDANSNVPVTNISWYDADKFCRLLTKQMENKLPEGYLFRLPTEAEWEYCCRAGSTTRFSCGNQEDELADFAVFGMDGGGAANVATKKPNNWGVYDMHGNVWEWCLDSKINYAASQTDNPIGSLTAPMRVARGGAWDSPATACRSANRIDHPKSYKNNNLGFRIVLAKKIYRKR